MKRLNILLVAQNYLPFVGGVEVHARQVAQKLAETDHVELVAMNFAPRGNLGRLDFLHTSVLAPAHPGYQDGPVPVHSLAPSKLDRLRMSPLLVRGVPFVRRIADRATNRLGYRFYRAVYLPRLKRLMRRMNADVVHSLAGGYLGWCAQTAAIQLGIPFVCTPFAHPHQWGDGPDDVAYYNRAGAVIGLVPTDAAYLNSIGVPQDKLHAIGVSPELPATTDPDGFRARHGLQGVPLVLYVGRMMPQKGATAVLAATHQVWQSSPDARFGFIGPASAEEATAFANVDPRIKYLGKVSLQEKADALAACDVFCMPSMSEILPTVYLEAWSYGKAVVGGRAHGLPELVEGNGAGIAASQQPADVAAALVRLLQDETLRHTLGQRGKDLVAAKYSVPAVTGQLLRLYRDTISKSRAVGGARATRVTPITAPEVQPASV